MAPGPCDSNALAENQCRSSDGSGMRIAYILSAYKHPEWTIRLVRRLHAPDHGFFIHYDLRSPAAEFEALAKALSGFSNVHFLERHRCCWGDFGHVLGTLKGIQAISEGGFVYDYGIVLTGQDYPLKSDAQIRQALREAKGRSFLQATPWPIPGWEKGRAINRVEHYHFHLRPPRWLRFVRRFEKVVHISLPLKRKVPGGLHVYFGSGYWYLSRACLRYVATFVEEKPEYVRFFRHASISDESFFQTMLMNSPLAKTIEPRSLTYVDWKPPWPAILTTEDLPKLQASGCLFARKFDPAVDARVLDELDATGGRTAEGGKLKPELGNGKSENEGGKLKTEN